jgi:hypothetical protein
VKELSPRSFLTTAPSQHSFFEHHFGPDSRSAAAVSCKMVLPITIVSNKFLSSSQWF